MNDTLSRTLSMIVVLHDCCHSLMTFAQQVTAGFAYLTISIEVIHWDIENKLRVSYLLGHCYIQSS